MSSRRVALVAAIFVISTTFARGRAEAQEFGPAYPLSADFRAPTGVAVDVLNHRVIVADTFNHRLKWAPIAGLRAPSATWTEFGFVEDVAVPERITNPLGVAADRLSRVYVTDTAGREVQRYRYDTIAMNYVADPTFARGTHLLADGTPLRPVDVAVDGADRVFVLDAMAGRILVSRPYDATWSIWRADPRWIGASGIDVNHVGDTVFLAHPRLNEVIVVPETGPTRSFGTYGIADGRFNAPQDVARLPDGRLVVSQSGNPKVVVITSAGAYDSTLGTDPLFFAPQHVAVGEGKVFVADSVRQRIVAFLGRETMMTGAFDVYVRDFIGDTGVDTTPTGWLVASPDVIIRRRPDVTAEVVAREGLERYLSESPVYGANNYVYVAVHNRGPFPAYGVVANLSWGDPMRAAEFPVGWQTEGFYAPYGSELSPNNVLSAPMVPARTTISGREVDGVVLVGPLVWQPPSPSATPLRDGQVALQVRLVNAFDAIPTVMTDPVLSSNNVTLRPTQIVRGPVAVGDQNLLAVRANFQAVAGTADLDAVHARIAETDRWVREVSYGGALIRSIDRGPVNLSHGAAHYEKLYLVEMATEVLNAVHTADDPVLDGATSDPSDDIDRVVIVVNAPGFSEDWATTGSWPYEINGRRRYLSVSVQGPNNNAEKYVHGFAHQLGLRDLYAHPETGFRPDTPVPDGWDPMTQTSGTAHPLVYSKQLANWLSPIGGLVQWIPRPARGSGPRVGEPPTHLSYQSVLESGQYGAIAIGLTAGVTAFDQETQFYMLEARSPSLLNADQNLPADGVIMYYANRLVPEGQAPLRLYDPTPSTSVADATLPVNASTSVPGTGITAQIQARDRGYSVQVDYEPPMSDADVYLVAGDPVWTSPDIWVDNPIDGGGFERAPLPGDEQPITRLVNRVFARVHNRGPADVFGVEVRFMLSDPYHTLDGGEDQFTEYRSVIVPRIPAGEPGFVDVFVTWRPVDNEDPHRCLRVELRRLTNDTNRENNWAQENLSVRTASHASPYDIIDLDVTYKNSGSAPKIVYLRQDGAPEGWQRELTWGEASVAPGETAHATLRVQPPEDVPDCRQHRIDVTAWTPQGDTLVRLGGTTLDLGLRRRTKLSTKGSFILGNDKKCAFDATSCDRIQVEGCTYPARKGETISVQFTDPNGKDHYARGATDELTGCFALSHPVTGGGDWQTRTFYQGDKCSGPARAEEKVEVPLAPSFDQGDSDEKEDYGILTYEQNDGGQTYKTYGTAK